MSRFQELIRGSTPHSKYILFALAYLQKSSLKQAFSTGEIYRVYEDVCKSEGTDPLSHQRVLELLKEWGFSDVTENRHTGVVRVKGAIGNTPSCATRIWFSILYLNSQKRSRISCLIFKTTNPTLNIQESCCWFK